MAQSVEAASTESRIIVLLNDIKKLFYQYLSTNALTNIHLSDRNNAYPTDSELEICNVIRLNQTTHAYKRPNALVLSPSAAMLRYKLRNLNLSILPD